MKPELFHSILEPMPLDHLQFMQQKFGELMQRAEGMRAGVLKAVWIHRGVCAGCVFMVLLQGHWAANQDKQVLVYINGMGSGVWGWAAYYAWQNARMKWAEYVSMVANLREDIARINAAINNKGAVNAD